MRESSGAKGFLAFRWKLFYVIAAFVLLMGALNLVIGSTMNDALRKEHDEKGAALAGDIAAGSTEQILIESRMTLAALLEEARNSNPEIVYLFVLDPRGGVVEHTFGGPFPADLLEIVRSRSNVPSRSPSFRTEKGIVADFAVPLMGGMAGTLHLGLSERNVLRRIRENRVHTGIATAVILAVGLMASHLLAAFLARPLNDLILAAGEMGKGNLDRRSRVKTRDEFALLSAAFDRMGDELRAHLAAREEAEERLRKAHGELERRVRERTAELAAANRELEAFSYSVSHDLRAPLRTIEGFGLALRREYSDRIDETGNGYLRRILGGCASMGNLIDDLLELSRLTGGEFRRETVDLSVLGRSIAEELRESSPGRAVDVEVAPAMTVRGDPTLLRIALGNLFGNAWKFTRKIAEPKIEFGFRPEDGRQVYFVRDNGVGFDMEYAGRLFGAFQRLHPSSEYEGSGIGLATVQRIVRRHGGDIWAEAQVGKGATFFFTLESGAPSA